MNTHTVLITAIAAMLSIVPARSADEPLTAAKLQGTWSGERFDSGNGGDGARGVKLALDIQGDRVTARRLPEGSIGEGIFKLSTDGRAIDATGVSSNYKGNSYLGVIKVEGDTLYWCTTAGGGKTQTRPDSFSADPARRTFLIVVKRQK